MNGQSFLMLDLRGRGTQAPPLLCWCADRHDDVLTLVAEQMLALRRHVAATPLPPAGASRERSDKLDGQEGRCRLL